VKFSGILGDDRCNGKIIFVILANGLSKTSCLAKYFNSIFFGNNEWPSGFPLAARSPRIIEGKYLKKLEVDIEDSLSLRSLTSLNLHQIAV